MADEMACSLENQYAGDEAWVGYVLLCRLEYPRFETEQPDLIRALMPHIDVALVVYQKMGSHSLAWISSKIPALDGLTAVQCLSEPHLMNRLREGLLRMPF